MAIVLISIPMAKSRFAVSAFSLCMPSVLPPALPSSRPSALPSSRPFALPSSSLLLFLMPSCLVSRLPAQTGYRDIFSSQRHISTALVWKGKRHLCSSPVSKLFRKSNISGFDISCPKILLKPTSVKGLMNLAISCSSLLVRLQI